MATQLVPQYMDAWKRRGQARAALGDVDGAASVWIPPPSLPSLIKQAAGKSSFVRLPVRMRLIISMCQYSSAYAWLACPSLGVICERGM